MNTQNFFEENTSDEEIDITPDISLLPKLGYAGYSAPQAVAELVDNAIDAGLDNTLLNVSVNIDKDSISVADNGSGMDKNTASKALILGFSLKQGQLGEFGLGLKTACLSLGDYFEVITTSTEEGCEYHLQFDKYEWQNQSKGWTLPLKKKPSNKKDHFTIVNIKKLKVFYPNLAEYIKSDLQKRYSPFIGTGQVEIKVNKKICESEELNLILETKNNFSIKLKSGNKIYGWYALLKEGSQKGLYGFSTFRRGRMITAYDKIGFEPHPTLARIVGEIHMDHVPVSTTKREFEKEKPEYREVEEAMKSELKEIIQLARKRASQDAITPEIKNNIEIWKDKITESLRSDDFKQYTSFFRGSILKGSNKSPEIAKIEIETRSEKQNLSEDKPESIKEQDRKPNETHLDRKHVIKIKGKNVEFKHLFSPLGTEAGWKTYNYNPKKGIEIFTNTDFPAYSATKDKAFYAVIHIAEAISEIFVQTTQEDIANMEELKELILRKASELKEEF